MKWDWLFKRDRRKREPRPRPIKETWYTAGEAPPNPFLGDDIGPEAFKRFGEVEDRLLDEAYSMKDYAAEDKGFHSTGVNSVLGINLEGTYNLLHHYYHYRGPVRNITNNLTQLCGSPEIKFGGDAETRAWEDIAFNQQFPLRWSRIIRNMERLFYMG
jgi:hypothetical protein